MTKRQMMKLKL